MSIIIHGITKEEFAKRMMGEGITIIDPDILGSFESFFGYRTEELPPHGDLIDRDELKGIIGKFSLSWEYGNGVSDCWDALIEAPTIIEAEGERE